MQLAWLKARQLGLTSLQIQLPRCCLYRQDRGSWIHKWNTESLRQGRDGKAEQQPSIDVSKQPVITYHSQSVCTRPRQARDSREMQGWRQRNLHQGISWAKSASPELHHSKSVILRPGGRGAQSGGLGSPPCKNSILALQVIFYTQCPSTTVNVRFYIKICH